MDPEKIMEATGGLVEKTGDAIDKNFTTKDEEQRNDVAFSQAAQSNATQRYKLTIKEDFLPSKLARPFVLYSCTIVLLFLILKASSILFDFTPPGSPDAVLSAYERARLDFVWTLLKELLFVFTLVIGPSVSFFFVDRMNQHNQKIKRGFFEPENEGLMQKAKRSIKGLFGA